jgi:glycosidase
MVLDFPFMEAVRASVGGHYGERFKSVLAHFEARQDAVAPGERVVFAGNHDVSRLMTEWGDNAEMWRLAEFLALTTPHTPLIYYGEELGLHGKVKRPDSTSDEEYVRTINAFPWAGDETAGFPGGQTPVTGLSDNARERNLEAARADAGSTFNMMKELLNLRRAFGVTPATRLAVRSDLYGHVIGWTMSRPRADGGRKCRSVMVNFDAANTYPIAPLHAGEGCGGAAHVVFAEHAAPRDDVYDLGPYAKVVYDND